MTQQPRIMPVGRYGLLQDAETPSATIRILRIDEGDASVGRHTHQLCDQTYVVLQGLAVITRGDQEIEAGPFDVIHVAAGTPHEARPSGGPAIIMNISIPPLAPGDQLPTP
jgi:mannose-6-phosphate isomerase-like protein (cupin superfamily)